MSFKPEVQVGKDPKWYDNALRFATRQEAEANVADLMNRWLAVVATRVVESDDPVNYRWTTRRGLVALDEDSSTPDFKEVP